MRHDHGRHVETMVNLLFFGAFPPAAAGPFGTGSWAYWAGVEDYWPYDPEKAKQTLEDAGWRDEDGDGIREAHGVEGIEDGTPLESATSLPPDTAASSRPSSFRPR